MSRIPRLETRRARHLAPEPQPVTEGEAVIVAPNGDEIYLAYAARVVPGADPERLELTYLAIGGTGRFARAEGEIVVRVIHSSPEAFVGRGEGSIRTVAPGRSER